jgi:preprotein translocase subunit SecE
MGRIQRKKSSAAKKKKKQAAANRATSGAAVAQKSDSKKAVSGVAPVKVTAKKQAPAPKKQTTGSSLTAVKPKDNIFTKTAQFLREVKVELKKVAWPTRKQTIGSTAVVIALVMLISLFLGVVDFGISSLIRIVLQ